MNTTKWTLMVMACMVIVPMAMQEAYPAVITVTDPGGVSRPVGNRFRDTLTISTAGGGSETNNIITLAPNVMNTRTKATFLDDVINGRVMGTKKFEHVTSMANGDDVTVRAKPNDLFITKIDIRTGAGGAAPEKDRIKFEAAEFAAPPALIFGIGLLAFDANGEPDNMLLGEGGIAAIELGGSNGLTVSADTTGKNITEILNTLANGFSSTSFIAKVLGNELQIENVTLDNSIAFSGTDPVFQYDVFASAIPEPTPFVLFSAGVVVLAIYTRRRQNQQTAEIGACLYRA